MKILHISTFDTGGAGRAAIRLHKALLEKGEQSYYLCLRKKTNVKNVFEFEVPKLSLLKRILRKVDLYRTQEDKNKILISSYRGEYDAFTFPFTDFDISDHPLVKESDIINLHWISWFVDYKSFFTKVNKPIVWTLHDMNPFQGGFHHNGDKLLNNWELEKRLEDIKYNILIHYPSLNIVALNNWMFKRSVQSRVFQNRPHTIIYNGIEGDIFKPSDRLKARTELNIPPDKVVFLFVSEFFRTKLKGFDILIKVIENFRTDNVIFYAIGDKQKLEVNNCIFLGIINNDEHLAKIYSAADAFVLPSREDNLPNVMLEALACGTPVIANPVGGIVDIIIENFNGILTDKIDEEGFLIALNKFIENRTLFDRNKIRKHALEFFSLKKNAEQYIALYSKILS